MADPAEALGLGSGSGDDYRTGPPPRWVQPWSDSAVRIATAGGALLTGFLLAAGLVVGRQAAIEQDARKSELIALVHERQEHAEELSSQLEALRAQVAEAEANAAAGLPALAARAAEVEAAAGLAALAGPGVTVTFADAEQRCAGARPEDCRIQDVDLQLAVNTLFALGAEAVAINGERVIATTAIRSAGQAILVNYRVLTSPYVIDAIGPAEQLAEGFRESQIGQDFSLWADAYGLGYSVSTAAELELPAYAGSVRLRTARVPEGAS
ncbi:MAG TPA: DUF881 domain-containing protein [Egibacteraceae bacterium]